MCVCVLDALSVAVHHNGTSHPHHSPESNKIQSEPKHQLNVAEWCECVVKMECRHSWRRTSIPSIACTFVICLYFMCGLFFYGFKHTLKPQRSISLFFICIHTHWHLTIFIRSFIFIVLFRLACVGTRRSCNRFDNHVSGLLGCQWCV